MIDKLQNLIFIYFFLDIGFSVNLFSFDFLVLSCCNLIGETDPYGFCSQSRWLETKWIDEVFERKFAPSLFLIIWIHLALASWIFLLIVKGMIFWLLSNFYICFQFFKGVCVILCLSISTLCICFLTLTVNSHFHFPAICLGVSPLCLK